MLSRLLRWVTLIAIPLAVAAIATTAHARKPKAIPAASVAATPALPSSMPALEAQQLRGDLLEMQVLQDQAQAQLDRATQELKARIHAAELRYHIALIATGRPTDHVDFATGVIARAELAPPPPSGPSPGAAAAAPLPTAPSPAPGAAPEPPPTARPAASAAPAAAGARRGDASAAAVSSSTPAGPPKATSAAAPHAPPLARK